MKIKYKDRIHELLPFIAQEQLARQGKAYAWSLYYHNNSDHDPETEKVQNNVQYIQMHSI